MGLLRDKAEKERAHARAALAQAARQADENQRLREMKPHVVAMLESRCPPSPSRVMHAALMSSACGARVQAPASPMSPVVPPGMALLRCSADGRRNTCTRLSTHGLCRDQRAKRLRAAEKEIGALKDAIREVAMSALRATSDGAENLAELSPGAHLLGGASANGAAGNGVSANGTGVVSAPEAGNGNGDKPDAQKGSN